MKNQASYRLRSQSESAVTTGKGKDNTPTKLDQSIARSTKPSTPSSSNVCNICKGIEDLRSVKLNEAIAEFASKLDSYKELSISLSDSTSTLNHAVDAIKHFISLTEPKEINKFFLKANDRISALGDSIYDLYVTKLDALEELVNKKIETVSSYSD